MTQRAILLRPTILLFATSLSLATSTTVARGQAGAPSATAAATPPAYDIVSIKQNKTGSGDAGMSVGEGFRLTATNVDLEALIEFAYNIHADQISRISGPVSSARFDIEAKVLPSESGPPPKITDKQLRAMVIPILTERFSLKTHTEPKTLPVYNLVVLPGGPKFTLKPAKEEDRNSSINTSASNDKIQLKAKGVSMAELAAALSDEVHRPVIDQTGLTGDCDLTLKYTPELEAQAVESSLSVFTAVQEQLGLKLQSGKGPVQALVIDHAEMPSEN